jgi:hypothetical protein
VQVDGDIPDQQAVPLGHENQPRTIVQPGQARQPAPAPELSSSSTSGREPISR